MKIRVKNIYQSSIFYCFTVINCDLSYTLLSHPWFKHNNSWRDVTN